MHKYKNDNKTFKVESVKCDPQHYMYIPPLYSMGLPKRFSPL